MILRIAFAVLTMTSASELYAADVNQGKNGIFEQTKPGYSELLRYIVDSQTRLCFASNGTSITGIPCTSLAQQTEWKNIITWVK